MRKSPTTKSTILEPVDSSFEGDDFTIGCMFHWFILKRLEGKEEQDGHMKNNSHGLTDTKRDILSFPMREVYTYVLAIYDAIQFTWDNSFLVLSQQ